MQNEWKLLHDQYGHLPFDKMDRLVEWNNLSQKFKCLKGQKVFCPSCVFGKMRKRTWRTKGQNGKKEIRKPNENYPGARVLLDQLVVA